MKIHYEYSNCLWIKKNGKGGRIKMFCLAGHRKGELFIVHKEKFAEFKKLNKYKDFERIDELLVVKGDPALRDILARTPREANQL